MDKRLIRLLNKGGVAVIPTDTIYGIVGSAFIPETVEKIYKLRKRATNKPFIILISSLNDLNHFSVQLTEKQKIFLQKHWPNPLSVVLPVVSGKWKYLHRGKNSLAFRMPKDEKLLKLLKQTGLLVAPSVNFEGGKVAETIKMAKKYFGDRVDFYVDGGKLESAPSTVVELRDDGLWQILRQGSYKLSS